MSKIMELWNLAYQIGDDAYRNNPQARKEIEEINKIIYKNYAK